MSKPNNPDRTIPGTSITESSMAKMLAHNRDLLGETPDPPVDHARIAEGLQASQPILMPGVGAPRIRASRVVERVLREGVAGTSPTPGQDNIAYLPPTTSNTADPGNDGKGPDAETEPASAGGPKESKVDRLLRDLSTLFSEQEDDKKFKGKNGDDKDDEDDEDDDDDKKKDKDDDEEEDVNESVEVHCEQCGYEEIYSLDEASISEGNVPLVDGKLDTKCPMCGADMDLSMIGRTNVGEIGDPNPRTDARGNSGPTESLEVPQPAILLARELMTRHVQGESLEALTKSVIEGDFLLKRSARQMARV